MIGYGGTEAERKQHSIYFLLCGCITSHIHPVEPTAKRPSTDRTRRSDWEEIGRCTIDLASDTVDLKMFGGILTSKLKSKFVLHSIFFFLTVISFFSATAARPLYVVGFSFMCHARARFISTDEFIGVEPIFLSWKFLLRSLLPGSYRYLYRSLSFVLILADRLDHCRFNKEIREKPGGTHLAVIPLIWFGNLILFCWCFARCHCVQFRICLPAEMKSEKYECLTRQSFSRKLNFGKNSNWYSVSTQTNGNRNSYTFQLREDLRWISLALFNVWWFVFFCMYDSDIYVHIVAKKIVNHFQQIYNIA